MGNLSTLALLACPLLMIGMFLVLFKKQDHHKGSQADEVTKDMERLKNQNEQLAQEIETLKRQKL